MDKSMKDKLILNEETLEAIKEARYMVEHPEYGKTYHTVETMLTDILEKD